MAANAAIHMTCSSHPAVPAPARLWPSPPVLPLWRLEPRLMAQSSAPHLQLGRRYRSRLGLVSRSGVIPIAHSQDTVGPFGRTVSDTAALLGVLTGADPRGCVDHEQGKPEIAGRFSRSRQGLLAIPRPRGPARRAYWRAADGVLGQ